MIEFGMDWYPEQWDCSYWEEDLRRMKALGIDTIRIGEFAWSELEPEEGVLRFEWLDDVMDLADQHGLKVILGTPTNCAPIWMYKNYPQTLRQDSSGKRIEYGVRGHRCMSDPLFRKYAERIITELTRRYAGRKTVRGWQIDNELEANGCTCESCRLQFISWLKEKYGKLENLNTAWKSEFWSGRISDFSEIDLKIPANRKPYWYNPAFILDLERWKADSLRDYIRFQCDLIRKADPDAVITTNSCLCREIPDYHQNAALLDVAAYDNYPPNYIPEDQPVEDYTNAPILDYVRGFKRQNFWVLEQLAGPMGCWGPIQPSLIPGMIEGYALQAIAHGADQLTFFRWRTASGGAEMFCHGLLDHNNKDNRRLRELGHLIQRVSSIENLDRSTALKQAAILYGRDQEVSFRNQDQGFDYWQPIRKIHGALMALGVSTDIIDERLAADPQANALDDYELVIVPSHFVLEPGLEKALERYAENGGSVLITSRSGVKDENGNCITDEYLPTVFRKLCGAYVEEYDAPGSAEITIEDENHQMYKTSGWADLLVMDGAKPRYFYADRWYRGWPAVSENEFGTGHVWYAGTNGDRDFWKDLLTVMLIQSGAHYYPDLPQGVELTRRIDPESGDVFEFVFNNTAAALSAPIREKEFRLEPLECLIIRNSEELL